MVECVYQRKSYLLCLFFRVQFADDPNLKYQDEGDAYLSYSSKGHFTPSKCFMLQS